MYELFHVISMTEIILYEIAWFDFSDNFLLRIAYLTE